MRPVRFSLPLHHASSRISSCIITRARDFRWKICLTSCSALWTAWECVEFFSQDLPISHMHRPNTYGKSMLLLANGDIDGSRQGDFQPLKGHLHRCETAQRRKMNGNVWLVKNPFRMISSFVLNFSGWDNGASMEIVSRDFATRYEAVFLFYLLFMLINKHK